MSNSIALRRLAVVLGMITAVLAGAASAHDGPLDSYGCHANIAHGSYHCHTGLLAERQYKSRAQMLEARKEREQEQEQQERRDKRREPTRSGG